MSGVNFFITATPL